MYLKYYLICETISQHTYDNFLNFANLNLFLE